MAALLRPGCMSQADSESRMKLGCAGSEWTCIQWPPPPSLACKWLSVDVFEGSAAVRLVVCAALRMRVCTSCCGGERVVRCGWRTVSCGKRDAAMQGAGCERAMRCPCSGCRPAPRCASVIGCSGWHTNGRASQFGIIITSMSSCLSPAAAQLSFQHIELAAKLFSSRARL